jgi:hypothetical protein
MLPSRFPFWSKDRSRTNRDGKEIISPMTQGGIERSWKEVYANNYMRRLPGFGWLIRRSEKERFEADVRAFEQVLTAWVEGFRKEAANDEKALIKRIVDLITEPCRTFSWNRKTKAHQHRGHCSHGYTKTPSNGPLR